MAEIKLKDCWWEGRNFHYVDEEDKEWVLTEAYISDYKMELPSCMKVVEEITWDRISTEG